MRKDVLKLLKFKLLNFVRDGGGDISLADLLPHRCWGNAFRGFRPAGQARPQFLLQKHPLWKQLNKQLDGCVYHTWQLFAVAVS